MRMKRIALILLSLVMVLSCVVAVPFSVAAENATATGADESLVGFKPEAVKAIDTSAAITMTEYCTGDYAFEAKADATALTVTINSADEFEMFANRVNAGDYFYKKTVVLTTDVDMNDRTDNTTALNTIGALNRKGTEVANNHASFRGTAFYGGGHTISNYVVNNNSFDSTTFGLFGLIYSQVYDLHLDNTCAFITSKNLSDTGCAGTIAGYLSNDNVAGAVINCYSEATMTLTGLASRRTGVGGIVGSSMSGNQQIRNCTYAGVLSSNNFDYLGGILGMAGRAGLKVTNCVNKGEIIYTGTADFADIGGILGNYTPYQHTANQFTTIDNCINYGTLKSANGAKVWIGGIIGMLRGLKDLSGYPTTVWTVVVTNCTSNSALVPNNSGKDADTSEIIAGMVDPLWNWTTDASTIVNAVHATASSMGDQLVLTASNNKVEYGYSAERVVKKDFSNADKYFEITASTTDAEINAASAAGKDFFIKTPDALMNFALRSDSATGFDKNRTVYLAADMDMSGKTWRPIASGANFKSTFDGQGYTISNLLSNSATSGISDKRFASGLFGRSYCVVKNVYMDNTCSVTSTSNVGAISSYAAWYNNGNDAAWNRAQILNCFNGGMVKGTTNSTAGICHAGGYVDVIGCTNAGLICDVNAKAGSILAGIVAGFSNAKLGGAGLILNNANYGSVTTRQGVAPYAVAGIAGRMGANGHTTAILFNANYGALSTGAGNMAGIAHFNILSAYAPAANRMICANNVNYGAMANGNAASTWYQNEFVVFTTDNASPSATGGVVKNNTVAADVHGYSDARIFAAKDYSKVPDIKDVFNFTGSAVGYKSGWNANKSPVIKITDAAGLDLLSAAAYFSPAVLANQYLVMPNDIDMTGWSIPADPTDSAAVWSAPNVFVPIGWLHPLDGEAGNAHINSLGAQYFRGFFDGLGNSVKNWTVDSGVFVNEVDGAKVHTGGNNIGLFGNTQYAIIQNVVLDESCNLVNDQGATDAIRALVCYGMQTNIINCKNEADLTGAAYSAGIIIYCNTSAVMNCTNDAEIQGGTYAAGIAIQIGTATIANCRNNGDITCYNWVGGIVAATINTGVNAIVVNNLNVGTVHGSAESYDDKGVLKAYTGAIIGDVKTDANAKVANNIDLGGVTFGKDSKVVEAGNEYEFGLSTPAAYAIAARAETPAELIEMLNTAYQNGTGNAVALRFVTTVDTLAYDTVGFKITWNGQTALVPMSTVYSSIIGAGETYTPDAVGYAGSEYFAVFTLTDIPADTEFTVEAYVITANGTEICGAARTIVA